jgi:sigma-B regulation protein RsbU (phosphoserine phosphatase)
VKPAPGGAPARLREAWREFGGALAGDPKRSLPARVADAAAALAGASRTILYLREKGSWVVAAAVGDGASALTLPDPCPPVSGFSHGALWVRLEAEGDLHGLLGLDGLEADEGAELAQLLGSLLGPHLGAHRFSRLVKEADFEVRTRLLELESLYDLGLSLAGQLDLSALADEVLFRSISLTDARKGSLVLLSENGSVLLSRHIGGELVSPRDVPRWELPEGGAAMNNAAASEPTAGLRLTSCEKCLAVAISVSGRRIGVLAVADKESRDGGVLDFTPTDARLLSLFAHQAAAAIETARLHKEALEKERIERELELAAAIQREILPRALPLVEGVELAAANVPTRQVGGDYFDWFPLSGGRLGFLVADVSGKGVPAALLVSTVHSAVHLQIDEAKDVADLVSRIDRHLRRFAATRKFLTLFFGLFEPDTGRFRYVSAGHNPALLARAKGPLLRLESTGVPVGMLPNASWREESVELLPGDLLCVYTDGVTEAVNDRDEEFGLDRLSEIVTRGASRPARELCDEVLAAVADFASGMPQYDDQTLLLLRRT